MYTDSTWCSRLAHKHSTSATPSSMAHIISPTPSLGQSVAQSITRVLHPGPGRGKAPHPLASGPFSPIMAALSIWWCRSWRPCVCPKPDGSPSDGASSAYCAVLLLGARNDCLAHSAHRLWLAQRIGWLPRMQSHGTCYSVAHASIYSYSSIGEPRSLLPVRLSCPPHHGIDYDYQIVSLPLSVDAA